MKIAIVGVGLIGGSMGLLLREYGMASTIIGVDQNEEHLQQALERKIIDIKLPLQDAIATSDIIILSTPVDVSSVLILSIMDLITEKHTVMDVGSTKSCICKAVANHPLRGQFVATHPMWGTEHSGPLHATKDAFHGRVTIMCEKHKSQQQSIDIVQRIYTLLGMQMVYMEDADTHDMHIAYISHISHISSFALACTVLEKEKEYEKILQLASSGFETTVRLAKSNKQMWVPIFIQNKKHILDVIDEYIHQINILKNAIVSEDKLTIANKIEEANLIRKILK